MPKLELDKDLKKLKELREINNITQDKMAQELGITKTAYWMKENGKSPITLVEAELISNFISEKQGKRISITDIFFIKR